MLTRVLVPALLALAVFPPALRADSFEVTLEVVDADKKPVARADVGLYWYHKDGAWIAETSRAAVTDSEGKARLTAADYGEKRPLLVLSADRKLGGYLSVGMADDGKTLTVKLGPTTRVKGKLECKESKSKPQWANVQFTPKGHRHYVASFVTKTAEFEFVLPAGKYTLSAYGSNEFEEFKRAVEVRQGRAEQDVGTLDFELSAIGKMMGKVPPDWTITAARGAKAGVKLSDYKGKWVYVEFWGFW